MPTLTISQLKLPDFPIQYNESKDQRTCRGLNCMREYCRLDVSMPHYDLLRFESFKKLARILYNADLAKEGVLMVIKQLQKGATDIIVERLWEKQEQLRQEIQDEQGKHSSTSGYDYYEHCIKQASKRFNCTTTHIGKIIAGSRNMRKADIESYDYDSNNEEDELLDEDQKMKREVAKATVELASQDRVSGFLVESGRHLTDARGLQGEIELIKCLSNAGITEDMYKIQSQQDAAAEGGTPDIRFNEPILINGFKINWIEAKKKLLIPDISSAWEMRSYNNQVNRYCSEFGPGAVVWTSKGGFCETIKQNPKVLHFRLINVPPSKKVKNKKTKSVKSNNEGYVPHNFPPLSNMYHDR